MKVCQRGHERPDHQVRCKVCNAAAVVVWRQRNPDQAKAHYKANAARALADPIKRARRYAAKDQWYAENAERERVKSLEAYYKRREAGTAALSTESVRRWRKNNPERAREMGENENARRLRLKNQAHGFHTVAEWKVIKRKQRDMCAACGIKCKLTKDHIVPLKLGGSDYAWNLQGLCGSCNSRKSASLKTGTQIGLYDQVADRVPLLKGEDSHG